MTETEDEPLDRGRWTVLALSTTAFTLLFSVWMMLGVLAIKIRSEFHFSQTQMDWLIASAILAGALPRTNFGIWADRFGGRNVILALSLFCAIPTYFLIHASSYWQFLICALGFGLAGNSFAAGISWNSSSFPSHRRGLALGIFGGGNVGASGTKLLVAVCPWVLTLGPVGGYLGGTIPGTWRLIPFLYSILLLLMAALLFALASRFDRKPMQRRSIREILGPLREIRVWQLSLDYVVVFGSFLALAAWLPGFYHDHYRMEIRDASILTAVFIFPASLLRPLGGWISDLHGPRAVTELVFITMTGALLVLSVPDGIYAGYVWKPGALVCTLLLFVVACGMGIGKGSVFKCVANDYPEDMGAVGGLVGTIGALGGFSLPPLFGFLGRVSGEPRLAFGPLLVLTLVSLVWLHARPRAVEERPILDDTQSS